MKKYDTLNEIYPEYISLDQLYRICHIAKRSARYLLENGIIPAIDAGRMTWRYKIAMVDVIDYLRQREKSGSGIPTGAVNSKKNKKYATGDRSSFSQVIAPGQEQSVTEYFCYVCAGYGDVLTVSDIADITGLHKKSLLKLLNAGHIKTITDSPRYIIPKQYLLEFVGTKRFLDIRTNSERFGKLLDGFKEWKLQPKTGKPHTRK